MPDPWPWPGDTQLQRARLIANSLLHYLSPEDQADMVARAHALGQTWLGPTEITFDNEDVVPTSTAARIVHVTAKTIRSWQYRGKLQPVTPGHYRVCDVLSAARRT